MRAITIQNPWCFAIQRLGKSLENRSWLPTPQTLQKGEVFALHAGKSKDCGYDDLVEELRSQGTLDQWQSELAHYQNYSGIFAVAVYGGHVTKSKSPWFVGPKGWILSNVFTLPEPIECRGFQSLWEVRDDLVREIRSQTPDAVAMSLGGRD